MNFQMKIAIAALIFALCLADTAGRARDACAGPTTASKDGASIHVTATISPRVTMRILDQSPLITLTEDDVARGYVEVRAATRIEVTSNVSAGYLLVFEKFDGIVGTFGDVDLQGLGRQVRLAADGGWIAQPSAPGTVTMELSYRFALGKDARPGTYRWPFLVSILSR